MSVIIPFDTGGILVVAGVTAAILTCLKKRREVYIRIWVSLPITKDSSTDFLDLYSVVYRVWGPMYC
jgi:hypothetical protein